MGKEFSLTFYVSALVYFELLISHFTTLLTTTVLCSHHEEF